MTGTPEQEVRPGACRGEGFRPTRARRERLGNHSWACRTCTPSPRRVSGARQSEPPPSAAAPACRRQRPRPPAAAPHPKAGSPPAAAPSPQTQVPVFDALLTRLEQENQSGSAAKGALDLGRLYLAGHSRGGAISALVQAKAPGEAARRAPPCRALTGPPNVAAPRLTRAPPAATTAPAAPAAAPAAIIVPTAAGPRRRRSRRHRCSHCRHPSRRRQLRAPAAWRPPSCWIQ